ncbi:ATP-dependent DNA helicase PcrA [Peptoclostridium acidaminophilum DSM 3953]|uniref:ATP-dependent DNA helicase n=1 Tax=Peptoclostridium acidaminophilum DSM 3953 TaxID=1286171 RepID=W8TGH8_PEPAC|nr:DNA helicase PcrA [Peptoclostridium acidaminophilum]AHM56938.1 ATP-dependent DNA helicase PcrA [Peptoclostridium acidaminophilum DSM 3953]
MNSEIEKRYSHLNEMQKKAVMTAEGPLLILAGAGSGKTTVLVNRIHYILATREIFPSNILAITFTNKAAREMKERVEKLLGENADGIWIGTFHSCCVRMLRRDIEKLGYARSFVIYDRADQLILLKDTIKELNINEKLYEPKMVINHISDAKDKLITPEEFGGIYKDDFKMSKIVDIYKLYQKKLKENNALDFDDIIVKTVELFENHPDVLNFYQRKFRYVMVDEYQDTNKAQYKLISLLSAHHRNLCAVGDDDQSIYGWRGADISNILNFEQEFEDATVVKLEQNYRSTSVILDSANHVIKNNMERKLKRLWTQQDGGDHIKIFKAGDEREEGDFIARQIKDLVDKNERSNSDFAVLYRTNAQSRAIEEALMRQNVSYKIYGGMKFYDRKEIKDIIAYLRLIQNPLDNISLKRIINVPKRGIGAKTLDKLEEVSLERENSIYSVLLELEHADYVSTRSKSKLNDFITHIGAFMAMKEVMNVSELIEKVLENTGYISELKAENTVESQTRIENLREFISSAIEFEQISEEKDLETFLASISLVADIDAMDDDEEYVSLMTLHSAKGLEFNTVFIAGMEEGIFPTNRAILDETQLEEERRLCYVGITRAKENLYMTYAHERTIYGRRNYGVSSRFINELPKDLTESLNVAARNDKRQAKSNRNKMDESIKQNFALDAASFGVYSSKSVLDDTSKAGIDNSDVSLGSKIVHPRFGSGTVVSKDGSNVTIAFENKGVKTINLEYIKLELA